MKKIVNFVRWIIGIFIILVGLLMMFVSVMTGILWALIGLIILPVVSKKIPKFKGRTPVLIIGCVVLFFAGIMADSSTVPSSQTDVAQQQTEDKQSEPQEAQQQTENKQSEPQETQQQTEDEQNDPQETQQQTADKQDVPGEGTASTDESLDTETTEELKRWIRGSVSTATGAVNVKKSDIKKWGKVSEQEFSPIWESVVLENICSQEQSLDLVDIASDMSDFKSMAAYLKGASDLYESLYSGTKKTVNIRKYADELSQMVAKNKELQKKYPYHLETAYPTYDTFYITQRLETAYSDNILGALQKEFDSYQAKSSSDWVAYNVEYVFDTATPGDTFCVIHADTLNPFTKTGAYDVCYVDTGTTTETVDDKGFRNTVPVLQLVDDADSIIADQQEYANSHSECLEILYSVKKALGYVPMETDHGAAPVVDNFNGEWADSEQTFWMEITEEEGSYVISAGQDLSETEFRQWSLEEDSVEGNGIFYSGGYVDLYLRDDGTVGTGAAYTEAFGVVFLDDEDVLHWVSDSGELEDAVLLYRQ